MTIRAAVIDPLPLYRHGVVAALHPIGCSIDEPDDLDSWLSDTGTQVVIIGLCTPADWELLARTYAARPDVTLLALVDDSTPETAVRAITAGAVAVLPRDGSSAVLLEAFGMLVSGRTLLPVEVIPHLVGARIAPEPVEHPDGPSAQERQWLQYLASGHTVADLARTARYSERMMFRLLRTLYTKLAVNGRTEALMLARDKGWI